MLSPGHIEDSSIKTISNFKAFFTAECRNVDDKKCSKWAKSTKGFCRKSPTFMFNKCKMACGFCAKGKNK